MNEEEFKSLYQRLCAPILAFASRQLQVETAEDVLADTFETAWAKAHAAPADTDACASWVFGIAKMKTLQALQRRTRKHHDHRFAEDFAAFPPPTRDFEDVVIASILGELLYQQLSVPEQELLRIAHLCDSDRSAAARALGISAGAFNTRLSRLRSRLVDLELAQHADRSDSTQSPHSQGIPGRGGPKKVTVASRPASCPLATDRPSVATL